MMSRLATALSVAFALVMILYVPAHANDDYLVPITVGGKTFTLTVSVGETGVGVRVSDPTVRIGALTKVQRGAVTLPTATPATAAATAATTAVATPAAAVTATPALAALDAAKAQAVTIAYDDLFRYNEQHVGKTVRYVGEVLQVQEKECLIFCDEDDTGYVLRVAVTEGSYGLWDDPIWVDYNGTQRFLEDDVVTVWGTVIGLEKYTAVLGNQVTIPSIKAIDIQLGEHGNPGASGAAAAAPTSPAAETTGDEVVSNSRASGAAVANGNANLRGGPGTGYPVVGGVDEGDALDVTARNEAGDWLQLAGGAWIAAFLVDNAPAAADVPVATEIPALPTPAAAPAESSAAAPASTPTTAAVSAGITPVGQEIEAGGWRFKVAEVHKRKAVYFYSNSYIAMGHYLIVVMEATNLQSGTDYFDRNIDPWVVDGAGTVFDIKGTASGYAQWQMGGLDSIFTSVNPGNFVRMAFAVDLPDSTGRLYLKTDVGVRIDLGDFSALASEDV